jgi:glutathione S-transferase
MKPVLYVGNQNYSSWSMRPWLVLTWGKIDFETRVVPLGGEGYTKRQMPAVLAVSPSGAVPALHVDGEVIGDSLAISEWAAEQSPSLWPKAPLVRALARSATAEMHSGFGAIRSQLPCNIRRRAEPRVLSSEVTQEIARLSSMWTSLRARNGGPYLFGDTRTIVDAFFTPIATRFRTYAVNLERDAQSYVDTLLDDPDFKTWEKAGIAESWTMPVWDSV